MIKLDHQDPQSYQHAFAKVNQNLVGVGVTAFNRIGPALIADNYQIICYKQGTDAKALSRLVKVSSIQDDFYKEGDITSLNTLAILEHPGVQKYLKKFGNNTCIFVYRTSERVSQICQKLGLKVIANPHDIRDKYEDKDQFFRIGRKIGLPMIAGIQLNISDLNEIAYENLTKEIGSKLVFQVVDFSKGGGKGTFFINSFDQVLAFKQAVAEFKKDKTDRDWQKVNVTKFILGPSPSITGCATRHGILTGPVQTQILDVPGLLMGRDPGGVYQGHDWAYKNYDQDIQNQADKIATTLGEYMYQQGYKGIFGVDLVIDESNNKVYPVECNPRYTGAFPVYSLIQQVYKEIPLDVFQFLEFLDIDYEMDFTAVNKSWKQPKNAAHLTLHNPYYSNWAKTTGDLPAGIFKLENGVLKRVRDGILYQDIEDESEFILTDSPPLLNELVKPGLRVGKLIFKTRVLVKPGELSPFASKVIEEVYKGFNFQPIEANHA